MRISTLTLGGLMLAATAAPAWAQDTAPPKPITVTGGVTLISDYRFRGLTQTDGGPAAQATINVNSSTGLYVGTWVSTIDGGDDGSTPALTGYGDAEVDLYGGYTKTLSNGFGFDAGLLYYYYPGGDKGLNTDFFEPYASISYTLGPVSTKVGVNYAWGGQSGLDFTSGKDDNTYVYGQAGVGIPGTPVTVTGHVGYTKGSLGLVNMNSADDSYWDWSLNAEAVGGPIKVGVTYLDTDVTDAYDPAVHGRFDQKLGRGSTVLGYIGYSF
ncbi:MAG: TorF family putative porin [Sphingomonas sp.]